MNRKIIKLSAIVIIFVTLISVIISFRLTIEYDKDNVKQSQLSGLDLLNYHNKQLEDMKELDHQIRITLPEGIKKTDIDFYDDYMHQQVIITVPGIEEEYFYEYPILGNISHIDNLMLSSDNGVGVIEITLDEVYDIKYSLDDAELILTYRRPKDIYDKVIVIDAGHGGSAPGAVKMGVMEKDLNLSIVEKLKKLLDQLEDESSVKVFYTRTEDINPTLDQRVQLANNVQADLFISVHNNSTRDGNMSDYHGTEVMYDEEKADEDMGSMQLSLIMLDETSKALGSKNDGLIRGNEIYIIRTSDVPVALVEVGFMTNNGELENLKTKKYQQKAAQGIYNGIIRAFEEGF